MDIYDVGNTVDGNPQRYFKKEIHKQQEDISNTTSTTINWGEKISQFYLQQEKSTNELKTV